MSEKLQSYKGIIILENPGTGEERKITAQAGGTWIFLFGPFYLFYHRVWLHGIICGALLCVGAHWLYIFFGKRVIVDSYIKRGWKVTAHYPDGKITKQVV